MFVVTVLTGKILLVKTVTERLMHQYNQYFKTILSYIGTINTHC